MSIFHVFRYLNFYQCERQTDSSGNELSDVIKGTDRALSG